MNIYIKRIKRVNSAKHKHKSNFTKISRDGSPFSAAMPSW